MNLYLVPTFKDGREKKACIPCGKIEEGNCMIYGTFGFSMCRKQRCDHAIENRKLEKHDLIEMSEVANLIETGDKVYIRRLKK